MNNTIAHNSFHRAILLGVLLSMTTTAPINAFIAPTCTSSVRYTNTNNDTPQLRLVRQSKSSDEDQENKVAVGSSEYYQGFMNRSLNEEPVERVTGDAILGPTFKFVGGFAAILMVLTLGFLASNGIL
eukprot:scaffold35328_cov62-Cyclotella_meneghiniana.AAC.6